MVRRTESFYSSGDENPKIERYRLRRPCLFIGSHHIRLSVAVTMMAELRLLIMILRGQGACICNVACEDESIGEMSRSIKTWIILPFPKMMLFSMTACHGIRKKSCFDTAHLCPKDNLIRPFYLTNLIFLTILIIRMILFLPCDKFPIPGISSDPTYVQLTALSTT